MAFLAPRNLNKGRCQYTIYEKVPIRPYFDGILCFVRDCCFVCCVSNAVFTCTNAHISLNVTIVRPQPFYLELAPPVINHGHSQHFSIEDNGKAAIPRQAHRRGALDVLCGGLPDDTACHAGGAAIATATSRPGANAVQSSTLRR